MKLMIASDIHGSARWCQKLLDAWRVEAPEQLILLGDLLYHGPRNDLPEDYAPKRVIGMLNAISDNLLCVRGNCEAEVDQMVLTFPVMADYAALWLSGHMIYLTHGHIYNEDHLPPLRPGSVLLCGHTHVPALRRHEGYTYLNPGSVAIPKASSPHSYLILEEGRVTWKDLGDDNRPWQLDNLW